jgi:nicotinamidase-related amidase
MQAAQIEIGKVDGIRFGPLGEGWMHLCVDMQRMFNESTPWQTPWMAKVMPNVAALVAHDPERTVFTRFVPPRTPDELPGTWRRYYERWQVMTRSRMAPALVEVAPELARYAPPAKVLDKQVYSPWVDGALSRLLTALHVDTLIVSGTETEVCVLATVLGAIDHGYRVIIATDAICSSADSTHDAMLEIYHSRFGMQVETAVVEEILEAAS